MSAAEPRVAVGMSGGVDSSVVAALLARQGYQAVGVTLQLRSCNEPIASRSCCSADGIVQARTVAGKLGIPHYIVDCAEEFEERVLRPAWRDYAAGRTPSPCLACNREIKFRLLRSFAARVGARFIATGHYARILESPSGPVLMRGVDRGKDQAYFLCTLEPGQLVDTLLPLGALTKSEVRALARTLELPTAERRESQDACFSSELGLAESLRVRLRLNEAPRPGSLVDPSGHVLGHHSGIHRFTIGQRHGLGISLGARAFVTRLSAEDATVTVSTDAADLLSDGLIAERVRWTSETPPARCQAQIRSRHSAAWAGVTAHGTDATRVRFDEPQRAVTPGQAIAFFDGERVIGSGWIADTFRERSP